VAMFLKYLRAPAAFLATLLASGLAFADYAVDMLEPVTPTARDAYDLHWGILWICVAIFFIVFGAMFWSILKHRKSVGAKAAQFHENTTIEILWTIIPLVVLVGMAWPATRTMIEMKDASNADMSVKVTGYQWRWEYDYQQDGIKLISSLATPRDQIEEFHKAGAKKNENYLLEVDHPLVVPVNKKVRLLITSNDVIHGWYVPQLGVHQYGIPGFIKDQWFIIDKPGTYRGQCSQICGKEHAYMPIVVEAKSAADYAAWVRDTKAKMPPPATPDAVPQQAPAQTAAAAPAQIAAAGAAGAGAAVAGGTAAAVNTAGTDPNKKWALEELKAKGEQVYAANCAACHQPTGKGMPPAFPPLDGSKVVTGPKGAQIAVELKGRPGTAMASFAHLSDVDLAAVITHTRNSWGNKTGEAIQPAEIAAARK
jgi:cytochrome c oxidase subunit II